MKTWQRSLALPTLLALALGLGAAAQGRGRGHEGDHGRGWGRHFDRHEREAIHHWQDEHREHPPLGFRAQDRLPPGLESRLRIGMVLEPELRRRMRPVPRGLLVLLAPAPRRYRYVVIGDHICLVGRGDRLDDVLHLELNF
ncbi:MAG TPA: hypothetical protein VMV31_06840 [Terriglobales bacterium]|nr:hypothetical protein [Terriglobales bacterium]